MYCIILYIKKFYFIFKIGYFGLRFCYFDLDSVQTSPYRIIFHSASAYYYYLLYEHREFLNSTMIKFNIHKIQYNIIHNFVMDSTNL